MSATHAVRNDELDKIAYQGARPSANCLAGVFYGHLHARSTVDDHAGSSPALACGTEAPTQPRSAAPGLSCLRVVFRGLTAQEPS
jgi:hypothetical protein